MTYDILHIIRHFFNSSNFQIPEIKLYNYVLYEFEKLLNSNSTTLSNFNLPLSAESVINYLNNSLLREELNYNVDELKKKKI